MVGKSFSSIWHKRRSAFVLLLVLALISIVPFPGEAIGQTPTIYFSDTFENGLGNWIVSGSDWGLTQSTARGGSFSVTDSPSGNYLPNAEAVMILQNSINLSSSTAPVLTFWHKINVPDYDDDGYVEVSKDGGNTWATAADYYNTTISTWSFVQINLSSYKSSAVKVRFRLRADSDATVGDGWCIDDVEIKEIDASILPPFSDTFENGLGNWIVSGSDWGLTQSTARSGGSSATDSPSGNYPPNAESVMILKNSIDLSNSTAPVLTFWHKIYVPDYDDEGHIEVSKDGGTTWATAANYYNTTISTWSFVQIGLSSYKSSAVKVRFRLRADSDATVGGGWHIDDVEIKELDASVLPPFSDNFESGLGNWIVSGSDWGLTQSTARSGDSSATDSPSGNYSPSAEAVMVLKNALNLSMSMAPGLTFWHKINVPDYDDDGFVEVSKDGGTTWTTIKDYYNITISSWGFVQLDLSSYKSSAVKIRFRLRTDSDTSVGDGWYIDDVEIKDYPTAPQAPTGVAAAPGNGKATITWSNISYATSYNIYWSSTSGVNKTNGTKISNVTNPYTHEGLNNGTTYYYVVTAVNAYGEGGISAQASAKPDTAYIPPSPPTMITPTEGDKQTVITWAAISGATSYNLYWSTTPGVTKATGTKIANVTSPYTHTGLTNFTTYYYILASVNAYGEGNASSVFSATPKGAPSVPPNISVTEGAGKATITWDNVNGATSYNIYWSTTTGVTKANGRQILNVTNPFVFENLINLTTYYYIVTAVSRNYGESVPSAQFSVTLTGPPYAPKFIKTTDADNGRVTVNWDTVSNAASYNIYWSTAPGVTIATGLKIANATSPYTHAGLTNLTTYYYIVTAENEYGEGPASLEGSETPTSSATTIKFGQAVSGNISAKGQSNEWKFFSNTNDKITIVTRADYIQPWIDVYGPDGSKVCSTTGYAYQYELNCSLPASGVYKILISDLEANSTGSYSLFVQRLNKPGNTTTIGFGQTLTGSLTGKTSMDTYLLSASADDKIILVTSADYIQPWIDVYGSDGSKICSTTGYAYHYELNCSLPANDAYRILVSDLEASSTGSYSLFVQRLNNPGNTTTIGFGQTLTGSLMAKASMDTYLLSASADDKIIVSTSADYIQPWIDVYGPDGSKICTATGYAYHYELNCSLPASGVYKILVSDLEANSAAVYSVSLNCLSGVCDTSKTYDIIATAGANGTIIPSGMVTLAEGASQAFTIKPNLNCHIADVKVDGVSVGAVESYTFSNLKAGHTINATFNGTKLLTGITVTGPQTTMTVSGTQTLTATARYSDSTTGTPTSPSWQSLNTAVVTVDAAGKVTALAAGSTSITASYGGFAGKFDITVGAIQAKQHYGNLILVAGGGIQDSLTDTTQNLADLVYSRFRNRLFTDADIYYINPKSWHNLDGDNKPDDIVDETIPTVTKFGDAITTWAKNQNSDGPLYIYLIDHGMTDQFLIFPDNEILTADQLKGYLDTFQTATGRKVVVVIDACYSGSFINNLVRPGETKDRVIITSTGEGIDYKENQGRTSFTQFFTDQLLIGDSLSQAQLKAKNTLMRRGAFLALVDPKLSETVPGSANSTCVGGCFLMAPLIPTFTEQSPNGTISATNSSQSFYVKLSSMEGIESVWAVATPPDFTPPAPSTDFQTPIVNLPTFNLTGPNGEGKFTGTYGPFNKSGDYQIVYYARNNMGIVGSSLLSTTITVTGSASTGDINGDGVVDIADAILGLKVMVGSAPAQGAPGGIRSDYATSGADVNGDNKIGLSEVIYILQKAAGAR